MTIIRNDKHARAGGDEVFLSGREYMGEWNARKCSTHPYAHAVARECQQCCADIPHPRILMVGLGGGYILRLLPNHYEVTVLEISKQVIKDYRWLATHRIDQCPQGPCPRVVQGDAHCPPHEVLAMPKFDALIEDGPPSCYVDGNPTVLRKLAPCVKPGGHLVANFWHEAMAADAMAAVATLWVKARQRLLPTAANQVIVVATRADETSPICSEPLLAPHPPPVALRPLEAAQLALGSWMPRVLAMSVDRFFKYESGAE